MEPDVGVRRAPGGVLALALLADLSAITYLFVATLGFMAHISLGDVSIAACVAIYGLSRIVASYGLRRMKPVGSLLERVSAWIWIAFAAVAGIYLFQEGLFAGGLFLIPGVVIATLELVYLGRIKPLFIEPGLPPSRAAVVGWFAVAAIVGCLGLVARNLVMHTGSHQRRTMADMRTIAMAWEARATDINRYNAAAIEFPMTGVTIDNLVTALSPTYIKKIPMHDGWGNNWQFGVDQPWGSSEAAQTYAIVSYGKDGKSQGKWSGGGTTSFDCDIVFSSGAFIQYPEGVQGQ